MRCIFFALLMFIAVPLQAQQVFSSEKFGFSMEEPEGWVKIKDKKLDYNLRGHHGFHVISFSKYDPKTHKGMNPIISVNAGSNYKDFKQQSGIMKERNFLNQTLSNFSVVEKPEIVMFKNLETFSRLDRYTLYGRKKEPFNVLRKSFIVPSGKYMFYIDFIDGQDTEDQTNLYEKLIESIKFGVN